MESYGNQQLIFRPLPGSAIPYFDLKINALPYGEHFLGCIA
jgi:hypothetical protein